MLERLKPLKAMGPDEVGLRVLKELSSTIAPILTYIPSVIQYWRNA